MIRFLEPYCLPPRPLSVIESVAVVMSDTYMFLVKHRKVHRLFYLASAALYGVAFLLLLEVVAVLVDRRLEQTNPLIAAHKNQSPLPILRDSLSVSDVAPWHPPAVGGWERASTFFADDASMGQVLDWGPRTKSLSEEDLQIRRDAFPLMSPAAREAYALLSGDLVFEVDGKYRIQGIYGAHKSLFPWYKRQMVRFILRYMSILEPLGKTIDATLQKGQSHSLEIPGPDGAPTRMTCVPSKEEAGRNRNAFVFVETHPDFVIDTAFSGLPEASRWEIYAYRYKADVRAEDHTHFCTNSRGVRADEIETPKPEGVFRILCVGGSTTDEGESNYKTYPHLLQETLQQKISGCRLEVINAGIPGASSFVHLLRFPEYLKLEPDLIIIHAGVNDLQRQYLDPMVNFLPANSRFMRRVFPTICAPSLKTFIERHRDNMGYSLEILTALAQRNGVAVALASIAYPDPTILNRTERQYYDYQASGDWTQPAFSLPRYVAYIRASNQLLLELSEAHNAFYFPVAERMTGGPDVFWDFCHMTQRGIETKAAVIAECVLSILAGRPFCQ